MRTMKTIDIITVTKNDEQNLTYTYQSIINAAKKRNIKITWIVIDSSSNSRIRNAVRNSKRLKNFAINYQKEKRLGIYLAMNRGIALVTSEFFMFLNSGDQLLDNFNEATVKLSKSYVTCFRTKWHDHMMIEQSRTWNSVICFPLAKLPNHQAMIFPNKFNSFRYNENFPISADQDMKLKLYKLGLLKIEDTAIVSSLLGGISSRKLKPKELISRCQESWKIFNDNLNAVHAVLLWVIYTLSFLKRLEYAQVVYKRSTRTQQ